MKIPRKCHDQKVQPLRGTKRRRNVVIQKGNAFRENIVNAIHKDETVAASLHPDTREKKYSERQIEVVATSLSSCTEKEMPLNQKYSQMTGKSTRRLIDTPNVWLMIL